MSVCHTKKKCHPFLFDACVFVCETIVSVFSYPRSAGCFWKCKDNFLQGAEAAELIYLMEPRLRKPTGDRREEQLLLDALGTSKGRW